jgi:hypothetical protein
MVLEKNKNRHFLKSIGNRKGQSCYSLHIYVLNSSHVNGKFSFTFGNYLHKGEIRQQERMVVKLETLAMAYHVFRMRDTKNVYSILMGTVFVSITTTYRKQ